MRQPKPKPKRVMMPWPEPPPRAPDPPAVSEPQPPATADDPMEPVSVHPAAKDAALAKFRAHFRACLLGEARSEARSTITPAQLETMLEDYLRLLREFDELPRLAKPWDHRLRQLANRQGITPEIMLEKLVKSEWVRSGAGILR